MKPENTLKKLYKINAILITVLIIITGLRALTYIETTYTIDGVVVEKTDDVAVFEDNTGNLWEMDNTKDIPEIGTRLHIQFNNNHTDNNRKDDTIVGFEKI